MVKASQNRFQKAPQTFAKLYAPSLSFWSTELHLVSYTFTIHCIFIQLSTTERKKPQWTETRKKKNSESFLSNLVTQFPCWGRHLTLRQCWPPLTCHLTTWCHRERLTDSNLSCLTGFSLACPYCQHSRPELTSSSSIHPFVYPDMDLPFTLSTSTSAL